MGPMKVTPRRSLPRGGKVIAPGAPASPCQRSRQGARRPKACDKRLVCLISYIHHASEYRQYCYVGNTAQQCRRGLFQDSDFAGDLEDSKSTSGGVLCIFGSHTFVPISWKCKKQTSVSHSSTEAEIISLDAGLRMDGIPALTLWDLVIEVFHSVPNKTEGPMREPRGNPSAIVKSNMHNPIPLSTPMSFQQTLITVHPRQRVLIPVTCCMSLRTNEAAIKTIIKGRSPTMRHVSRTLRVALDWLFDRINLDQKKFKSVTLTPNTNSQTYGLKGISHVVSDLFGAASFMRRLNEEWKDGNGIVPNCGQRAVHTLAAILHQEGKTNPYIPKHSRERQRPIEEKSRLERQWKSWGWNRWSQSSSSSSTTWWQPQEYQEAQKRQEWQGQQEWQGWREWKEKVQHL